MKKNSFFLLLTASIGFMSCNNNMGYKKTKSGLLYKIVVAGKGELPKEGEIFKINFTQKLNDSLLRSSYSRMPIYPPVPAATAANSGAYDPSELFPLLHKGDSVEIVQLVDTLMKKVPEGGMPPFMKKGDRVVLTLKVEDILKSDSLVRLDQEKYRAAEDAARAEDEKKYAKIREEEMKKYMEVRDKEMKEDIGGQIIQMEALLAKKGIKAQKTGLGTFVEIKDAGNGPQVTNGSTVSVKYTGRKVSNDSIFESNADGKMPPITVSVGQGKVIKGWDEGLLLFKKGGKGTLYIPGALAYGRNPNPQSPFGSNEALKFEIEVLDVLAAGATPAPTPAAAGEAPHDGHGH